MRHLFLFLAFFTASSLFAQAPQSVFFETGRAELGTAAQQSLDALAAQLQTAADYALRIEAFTDERGSESYNQALARQRSAAVDAYLRQKGIYMDDAVVRNVGEVPSAKADAALAQNRRVDVHATQTSLRDFSDMQQRLAQTNEEVLRADPEQDTRLTGKNGTVLVIPAYSFEFEDGTTPTGPVEITLIEALNPSDWILHGLGTSSGGQMLQTGGMAFIDAKSGGRSLRLTEGGSIQVALPAVGKPDPAMKLFYGTHSADSSMDWKLTEQTFTQAITPRVTLDVDPVIGQRLTAMRPKSWPEPHLPALTPVGDEPQPPAAPLRPREPRKIGWNEVQKMFGAIDGKTLSKKRLKKANVHYKNLSETYSRDSANYVLLLARYEKNVAAHAVAVEKHQQVHAAWVANLQHTLEYLATYTFDKQMSLYVRDVQEALPVLGKNIRKYYVYRDLNQTLNKRVNRAQNLRATLITKLPKNDREDLYDRYVGRRTMEKYPSYDVLYANAHHKLTQDSLMTLQRKMLKDIGFLNLSDSLRGELRDKTMIVDKNRNLINGYVAEVTKLGWINCDKFYNSPLPLERVYVQESEAAMIYVVFRDIRSIIQCYKGGKDAYFAAGLPKGSKVSIVAIKMTGGIPQLAMTDTEVGALKTPHELKYKSMPLRSLREELQKLNI
jgi:hypothetical protein